jgi:hypothetical protein
LIWTYAKSSAIITTKGSEVLGYYKWQVLKNFRIEGYSAYGTKDGNFKYNIGLSTRVSFLIPGLHLTPTMSTRLPYMTSKKTFKLYDPRPINISTFITMWAGSIWKHRLFLKRKASGHSIARNYTQIQLCL